MTPSPITPGDSLAAVASAIGEIALSMPPSKEGSKLFELRTRLERIDAEMRLTNEELSGAVGQYYELTKELRAKLAACESALKGLYDMYSHAWDLSDGSGLIMLADSIPRFEAAHHAAHLALGYPELICDEDDDIASRAAGE